jgi:hypothetical protein
MRMPPGMTESIASIRRNLNAIDQLIMQGTRAACEARETLRRADDLLERDPLAAFSKSERRLPSHIRSCPECRGTGRVTLISRELLLKKAKRPV